MRKIVSVAAAQFAGSVAAAAAQDVLPRPDPVFRGKIGETYKDSQPDFPAPVKAPAGAPNVLLVILDDTGFGHAGTFGGGVATPTLDRLAGEGLRYNEFHTTALCSPTRAALLTGRNHHSVATGVVIEMGTGYPGYSGIVPNTTAGLPEILRQSGYATAAFGKWHNTPDNEITPSGPFDRWPTGRTWGFEYFYGFMNGETNQYYPVLYRNTTPVPQPRTPEEGYHLTEDLVDEAIGWLDRVNATNPGKPWFAYFSTGAIHAPHHAPKAYRDKYKGRFDAGWDVYREQTLARQKQLGVVPPDTVLTPRPPELPAWNDQPKDAQRVFNRLMENYSAYLEHTDVQIGRLIAAIDKLGELDDTLVIYIVGDNGASGEGGLEGTISELASVNGLQFGLPSIEAKLDDIGGPDTEPHVPAAWAWAANAPFKWTKQIASHLGGTRNGLVVRWPKGFAARGQVRSQFHHVIDIAPTILEAAHIGEPKVVNGIEQKPIEGVSMLYSFDHPAEKSHRTVQYFELLGNRAIYKDGWMASARHGRLPWQTAGAATGDFQSDPWELYNLDEDFSQANDLAAKYPDKVAELKGVFMEEARKYNVLPLDDRLSERFDMSLRPNPLVGLTSVVYRPGVTGINESATLNTHNVPFSVTAEVVVGEGGADGVLAAIGGVSSGWTLYVKDGVPAFCYNFFDVDLTHVAAGERLPAGRSTVRVEVSPAEPGFFKPADVKLLVNGRQVGAGRIGRTIPFRYSAEPFDVGRDTVSSVCKDYRAPFPFQGTIEQVMVDLK